MGAARPVVFVSYGRSDAAEFVDRLVAELDRRGFDVWHDITGIQPGSRWEDAIADAIDACNAVIAVLTPHAVRRQTSGGIDGVCLDELSYARFGPYPKPVIPVKILECQIPFSIYRLSYVDLLEWSQSSQVFNRGIDQIVRGLEAALRGEQPELRRFKVPVVLDQGAYLDEKREGFTGREWLFDRVNAWLGEAASESALVICGDPGIGKSAFIAELADRNPGGRVVACHFCTREDRLTLEGGAFVSNLAGMLASRLPHYAPVLEDHEIQAALRQVQAYPGQALDRVIVAPLSRLPAPASGACLILVDGLDEAMTASLHAGTADDGNIVSLLASRLGRLPSWLRVIATARRDQHTADELAGLRADIIDAQAEENMRDLANYVGAQVRSGLRAGNPASVTDEIVKASDGNFLYAKSVLRELERDQIPLGSLGSLPVGMSGFYGRQFRRLLAPAADDAAARPVLEVLVAAQAPLDIQTVTSAAAIDQYETVATLGRLSQFVKDRDGGIVLFHRSLADWLIRPQTSYFVSPLRGHERLAASYVAALDVGQQPRAPAAGTMAVVYNGRYGLDHFAQAGVAISASWNPWVFAATALSAGETGYGVGGEIQFVPVFAQRYVTSALAAGDLAKISGLVLLTAQAARTRYHDGGVLNISIAADGTWTQTVLGEATATLALHQALTLSAWAGAITNAVVDACPDRTEELASAFKTLAGLGYLAGGLDIAWAPSSGSLADRGGALYRQLTALARTNEPWRDEDDQRLRELVQRGATAPWWDLFRSPEAVRQRAIKLGLTLPEN
jgi:TIR domain